MSGPHPDDLIRLGWQCVHFTAVRPDREGLSELQIEVAEIDGSAVRNDEELFGALDAALSFPDYFGANWDAVDECLRGLSEWLPAQGYVLVVNGAEDLWRQAPKTAGALVEAWLTAAGHWAHRGVPFHLVFEW
ncbi:MAG: barstar family protein [Solirubrobacterales bacterium]